MKIHEFHELCFKIYYFACLIQNPIIQSFQLIFQLYLLSLMLTVLQSFVPRLPLINNKLFLL